MKIKIEWKNYRHKTLEALIAEAIDYGVKVSCASSNAACVSDHKDSVVLDGRTEAVKHVVEHNWQVSRYFQTYDELLACEYIKTLDLLATIN